MKNLKIRTKLLATFMLVIILFIGTVAIAIYGLQANANKYSEFYNVEYKVTNNIMSMRRGPIMDTENVVHLYMGYYAEGSGIHNHRER